MMSADRSRRRRAMDRTNADRDNTTIDRNAEEALRSLVRVLGREAARELFAKSCATVDNDVVAEGRT